MKFQYTFDNLREEAYSAADVVKATGIEPTDLQILCNRKLIGFKSVKFGERTFRRFCLIEIFTIKAIETMHPFGVDYAKATEVVQQIRLAVIEFFDSWRGHTSRPYLVIFNQETDEGRTAFCSGDRQIATIAEGLVAGAIVLNLNTVISMAMGSLFTHEPGGDPPNPQREAE